jgi:hypothetical protein
LTYSSDEDLFANIFFPDTDPSLILFCIGSITPHSRQICCDKPCIQRFDETPRDCLRLTCRKPSKIVHSHFSRHTKARMWFLCRIRSKIII